MITQIDLEIIMDMNTTVTVVLTQDGADVWNKHHKDLDVPEKYFTKTPGTLKLPMWELMNVFGPALYHGSETKIFAYDNQMIV